MTSDSTTTTTTTMIAMRVPWDKDTDFRPAALACAVGEVTPLTDETAESSKLKFNKASVKRVENKNTFDSRIYRVIENEQRLSHSLRY
jgi:hypothetical protein